MVEQTLAGQMDRDGMSFYVETVLSGLAAMTIDAITAARRTMSI